MAAEDGATAEELKAVAKRIRERSEYDPESSGCLIWKGGKSGSGYGAVKFKGKVRRVHQLMFLAEKGPIPEGHKVRHTCDRPLCVEPEHLVSGTQQENMNDMVIRGRSAAGKPKIPRLTDAEVVAIDALRKFHPDWTVQEIADELGIHRNTADDILNDEQRIEDASEREFERLGYEPGKEMDIPPVDWPGRKLKPFTS